MTDLLKAYSLWIEGEGGIGFDPQILYPQSSILDYSVSLMAVYVTLVLKASCLIMIIKKVYSVSVTLFIEHALFYKLQVVILPPTPPCHESQQCTTHENRILFFNW